MEDKNDGNGNLWGPDQNQNPRNGTYNSQGEESSTGASGFNAGDNEDAEPELSNDIDAERGDNDDFTTNDYENDESI